MEKADSKVVFIIFILSAFALFVPVFSGYLVALAMLLLSVFYVLGGYSSDEVKGRSRFFSMIAPVTSAIYVFASCCAVAVILSLLQGNMADSGSVLRGFANYLVKMVLLWFFYLMFFWRMSLSTKYSRGFALAFVVLALINLVYCLAQRSMGLDWVHGIGEHLPENRFSNGVYRVSGFMGHPLTFAYCHTLAAVVTYGLSWVLASNWEKIAWRIAAILSISAVVIAGSRGPQMVLVVGLLISTPPNLLWDHWRKILIISVAFGFVLQGFGLLDRFHELFQVGMGGDMRTVHWAVYWDIFKDHPFFGIGPGAHDQAISAYYSALGADANIKLAHNAFLQYAAEFGVLGVLGLVVWIRALMVLAIGSKRVGRIIWSTIVAILLGALTQNNLQDSEFVLAFTTWLMVLVTKEVEISEFLSARQSKTENLIAREGVAPA